MTVASLLRSAATRVWIVLVTLTLVSWTLGASHGLGGGHAVAAIVILAVAVFKIRLIGMYFMELRDAPWALRGLFEGYCVILFVLLTGSYLVAPLT